jgi:hypothetical protein
MRKVSTAAIAGALAVPAAAGAAGAAGTAPNGGVLAQYHGRTINLAESWEGAHVCVQYAAGDVRCYDDASEVEDPLVRAARQQAAGVAAPLSCSGGGTVSLFRDIGFGGDELRMPSLSGQWANLGTYGFNNDMESWDNPTNCAAQVADGTGGSGDHLTLAANSSASSVGTSWKNRASSITTQ